MSTLLKKHYLICYDIVQHKPRQRLSKHLLNYGTRVQKSVFELYGSSPFTQCINGLEPYITQEDSVRIYHLGTKGVERTTLLGSATALQTPTSHIIL